jgi:hypothetical protein
LKNKLYSTGKIATGVAVATGSVVVGVPATMALTVVGRRDGSRLGIMLTKLGVLKGVEICVNGVMDFKKSTN